MNIKAIGKKRLILAGILVLLLIFMALVPTIANLYTVILLASIMMYIVLTVSWTIFSGTTGYLSLATAAFFGVGVYTAAMLGGKMPLIIIVILGGLISLLVAALVGALTLRLRGVYFAMFTLGLVQLISYFLIWYEVKYTGTRGRFVILVDNEVVYYIMLGILVLLLIVTFYIRHSKFGLALQSIGEQEEAAAHAGVNVTLVKVVTFAISSFFMGAAGAIMATKWTYIDPGIAFNINLSFLPVLMAIFGGMGNLYGPIIGAAIFAYLSELLSTKFPYYYMLIFGVLMTVAVLYMPEGIIGLLQKLRKRLMGGQRAHS